MIKETASVTAKQKEAPMNKHEEATETDVVESQCTHHWLIDRPNGPTSLAVCKLCGDQTEFRNSIQGTGWDRDSQQRKRSNQSQAKSG